MGTNFIVVVIVLLLAITNSLMFITTKKLTDSKWTELIDKQQIVESNKLAELTAKVLTAEREAEQLKSTLELQNEENDRKLQTISVVNRELANKYGGLLDPGRRESCGSSSAKTTNSSGAAVDAATSGRLSAEATEFLLSESKRADEAAAYAVACYQWIKETGRVK